MALVQNRQVLFAGVMILLVVAMPMMMNNMSDEDRALMEAQQSAMMGDGSNPMAGLMGMMGIKAPDSSALMSGVAGADSDDEDGPSSKPKLRAA